jgi:hypothetical protein
MPWLPRLLFRLILGLAVLLLLLVLLAPLLDRPQAPAEGWARVAALFARDAAVRRTAVASAVGLAVTAWVFFRPAGRVFTLPRKVRKLRKPPPPTGAGA